MAIIEIVLPNGTVVEMPDDAPKEQFARIRDLGESMKLKEQLQGVPAQRKALTAKLQKDADAKLASAPTESFADKAAYGVMRLQRALSPGVSGHPELIALDNRATALQKALHERESRLSQHKADNAGIAEAAKHYGGQAAGAATRGALGAMGLLSDIAAYGKGDKSFPVSAALGTIGAAPQNAAQSYLMSGLEGATGAVTGGPAKTIAANLAKGAAVGLAGEAGNQLLPETPYGRALGSVAGMTGVAVPSMLKSTREGVVRQAMQGVNPEELRAAGREQAMAHSVGVKTNVAQHMLRETNLDTTAQKLAESEFGPKITQQMREQPAQIADTAQGYLNMLPGKRVADDTIANTVKERATEVGEALKKQRGDDFRTAMAAELRTLKEEKMPGMQQAMKELLLARDGSDAAARALQGTKNSQKTFIETKYPLPPEVPTTLLSKTGKPLTGRAAELARASAQKDYADKLTSAEILRAQSEGSPTLTRVMSRQQEDLSQANSIRDLAKARMNAVKKDFRALSEVPADSMRSAIGELYKKIRMYENEPIGAELEKFAKNLQDSPNSPYITDPAKLDRLIRNAQHRVKLNGLNLETAGMDAGAKKQVYRVLSEFRDALGASHRPYKAGQGAYAAFTENTYNPWKQSVTGRLAGKGYDPAKQSSAEQLFAVFDKPSPRHAPGQARSSDILTLQRDLATTSDGKEVFQDTAKTWLVKNLDASMKADGNRLDKNIGSTLHKALYGQPELASRTEDVLVGVARSQGLKDDTYVKAFSNLQRLLGAASRRVPSSGLSGAELTRGSQSTTLRALSGFSLAGIVRAPARIINERLHGDAFRFLDDLMSKPEGVEIMIELSKAKPHLENRAALATFDKLGRYLATTVPDQPSPEGARARAAGAEAQGQQKSEEE